MFFTEKLQQLIPVIKTAEMGTNFSFTLHYNNHNAKISNNGEETQ